jgi:hypothetical protein
MSWRDHIKVHPAADLFPLLKDTDPKALQDLADDIKANGQQVAIAFWQDAEGARWLLDGRNRLDAMELAGAGQLTGFCDNLVRLVWGGATNKDRTESCKHRIHVHGDPYAYVLSANAHRRHLTAEKKVELIAAVLKVKPDQSDRTTAKMVKASPTTVGKVRRELEAAGDVSTVDTRTDSKGRQQPAHKSASVIHKEGDPTTEPAAKEEPIRPPAQTVSPPANPALCFDDWQARDRWLIANIDIGGAIKLQDGTSVTRIAVPEKNHKTPMRRARDALMELTTPYQFMKFDIWYKARRKELLDSLTKLPSVPAGQHVSPAAPDAAPNPSPATVAPPAATAEPTATDRLVARGLTKERATAHLAAATPMEDLASVVASAQEDKAFRGWIERGHALGEDPPPGYQDDAELFLAATLTEKKQVRQAIL